MNKDAKIYQIARGDDDSIDDERVEIIVSKAKNQIQNYYTIAKENELNAREALNEAYDSVRCEGFDVDIILEAKEDKKEAEKRIEDAKALYKELGFEGELN